ncbi:MAG: ATP-binding protein [Oscillospiraceae bacterium]|nr:ATP-binding protein [Oscillospiraceae bacterium]
MEKIHLHYEVDGDNFMAAGEASCDMKRVLKQLGFDSETIRRASICMYEGEINMVIHADGGTADVYVETSRIEIVLTDSGPGIEDVSQAMQRGFSTATQSIRELGFGAGMGLPNMEQYSDWMDVSSEVGVGTTVTVRIALGETA